MVIVVIGVAGSGKTTVGTMLADAMKCAFVEGDTLHPKENIDKMSRGIPLTDSDRSPWLSAIHARILDYSERGQNVVVACSALKQVYRRAIAKGIPTIWVYLKGSPALIRSRLRHRSSHFMKADMLASQFEALEEPSDALVVDVSAPPSAIVEHILSQLPMRSRTDVTGKPDERSSIVEPGTDVRVLPDVNELSLRAALAAVRTINEVVRAKGRCSLVLSGGNTPRLLYTLLASKFRDEIPWARTIVFWGDERYVSPDDRESNYRMAKKTLLDHVPCPGENIHPMPTHFPSAAEAARDYERTLRRYFANEWPSFDLVFLGLGVDGHTASLFPESTALEERTRLAVAVNAPADPPLRLTLTLPALNAAANVYVLAAGAKKARVLHEVLTRTPDPSLYPLSGVRPTEGRLIWWVDQNAAAWRTSVQPPPVGSLG